MKMDAKSISNEFQTVTRACRKIHNLFTCQVCFEVQDEESTFFYLKCRHVFCSKCVSNDKPCPICFDSDVPDDSWKQVKVTEQEHVLAIYRFALRFMTGEFEVDEVSEEKKTDSNVKTENNSKNGQNESDTSQEGNDEESKPCQKKMRKGFNVSKRNYKGETPLHLACRKADMNLMEALIAAGANPNARDHAGWTPLHDSIIYGKKPVIRFLLSNGARVNIPGHENTTALHQAVTNKNASLVKLLMKHGANVNAKDIYGESPMDFAKKSNLTGIVEIMENTPVKYELPPGTPKTLLKNEKILFGYNLKDSEAELMKKFAQTFEYTIVERIALEMSAPYIITSDVKPKITWTIIPGVLKACHVIHPNWMSDSLTGGSVRKTGSYKMKGEEFDGFVKSRQNEVDQLPGLFSGCHFHFGGNFQMYKTKNSTFRKDELALLVTKYDGAVLTRMPDPESLTLDKTVPYHAKPDSSLAKTSHFIIYCKETWDPVLKYNMVHMKTLPVEWLLASIYRFELIDPRVDQSYMDYI